MKEGADTLRDVTVNFGINYMAAWHMIEFSVMNETQIAEDLKSGLIFEWLSFIDRYTDSNTNNFAEAIMKLFLTRAEHSKFFRIFSNQNFEMYHN